MRRLLNRFRRDQRGSAAIELAAIGTVLAVALMNVTDVGRYAFQTSEVNAAAQAGAEAALVTCDTSHTPATVNCSGLTSAVTTAIQTTRLGSQVTLSGVTEGYYCLDTTNTLQQVGTTSSKPSDCSSVSNAATGATPTLYLKVAVSSPFQALFTGLTLAQSFSSTIDRTAWMRMA